MTVKKSTLLILSLLMLLLPSCTENSASAKEVMSNILAVLPDAPAGRAYFSEAAAGEDEYIKDSLVTALFGAGEYPKELEFVESFAFRISSFSVPYEIAVFKAKTQDDTADISKMCRRRIDTVRALVSRDGNDTDRTIAEEASIYVTGKYVLLVMTDRNKTVFDVAKDAIH